VNSLKILYIGANGGTSRHRALALQRLGHSVHILDTDALLPRGRLVGKWIFETGGLFLERLAYAKFLDAIPAHIDFDLVHVNDGELVGAPLVIELKRRYGKVINYNSDDPFGTRDHRKWRLYLQAVPYYDLIIVVRECNVGEARDRGAQDVLFVFRTADEVAHVPRSITARDRQTWFGEVVFVGTYMPERGPFMAELVSRGVPLSIRGNRWERAREWPLLRRYWRGPGILEEDYAKAVQCAKICLGLLSKDNRDLHTTRSSEIPYLGGLFCAQRTAEHLALYEEDREAVFWNDAQECAEKCMQLLENEPRRLRIAENGRQRCIRNATLNEPAMRSILDRALSGDESRSRNSPPLLKRAADGIL